MNELHKQLGGDPILLLFITILIFWTIIYFMPKKISKLEMYTTSLFATVLQLLTDIYLEFKYGLYYYFWPEIDFISLLVVFGIYPAVNIIFLNFYPETKTLRTKALYITGWSLFAIAYEAVAANTFLFNYVTWKLWYSAPIYPILYIILVYNWKLIKKLQQSAR